MSDLKNFSAVLEGIGLFFAVFFLVAEVVEVVYSRSSRPS
jgi:hypothetical protein